MRRLLVFGFSLVFWAATASAQSGRAYLDWDDCLGGAGSTTRHFSCDTNNGASELVTSFVLGQEFPDFQGVAIIMDMRSDSPTLPDWWQLYNVGACRQAGIAVSADFSNPPFEADFCTTAWAETPQGGIGAYQTALFPPPPPLNVPLPNRARLKVAFVAPNPRPLGADVEYFAARIIIHHTKTVGDSACAGCATPVCIILTELDVLGSGSWMPLYGDCVGWQQDGYCCYLYGSNRTWQLIRGLQR